MFWDEKKHKANLLLKIACRTAFESKFYAFKLKKGFAFLDFRMKRRTLHFNAPLNGLSQISYYYKIKNNKLCSTGYLYQALWLPVLF